VHDKGSHVVRDSREDSFSLRRGYIKTGKRFIYVSFEETRFLAYIIKRIVSITSLSRKTKRIIGRGCISQTFLRVFFSSRLVYRRILKDREDCDYHPYAIAFISWTNICTYVFLLFL